MDCYLEALENRFLLLVDLIKNHDSIYSILANFKVINDKFLSPLVQYYIQHFPLDHKNSRSRALDTHKKNNNNNNNKCISIYILFWTYYLGQL